MQAWDEAIRLLPEALGEAASKWDGRGAEELRLRLGQLPTLVRNRREEAFSGAPVTKMQLERIVEKASGASVHAVLEALREGYLSYHGLRIGVCGAAVRGAGGMEGFRHITSLAIRIPSEQLGLCRAWYAELYPNGFRNTLLLSPPGGGKTTALRDLIRELSERGYRVAVADERSELAACGADGLHFSLGPHCDVLAGLHKTEAASILLRAMNPEILAMDEIGTAEELDTLERLVCGGVGILATCHASGLRELAAHPLLGSVLDRELFSAALIIRQCGEGRRYAVERLRA